MTQRTWMSVTVAVTIAVSLACTSSHEARESDSAMPEVEQRIPTIDHVSPARDFVGERPARFEWTAAEGADHYAIGIWDDVDRLIWRNNHVQGTSVALPTDIELGFGTYFWSVIAVRDERPVAETGRSAFVVR